MPSIAKIKKGSSLVCLTAYSAPMARLADAAADLVLVGDSLGTVLYGFDSTLPVTLEMMIQHGRAVAAHCDNAVVVVDLPFGSYQESPAQAFHSAARVLKETGALAVKLEGGQEMAETVTFLTDRGVPVVGHVGLMPQHAKAKGYRRVEDKAGVLASAEAVQEAGAFALVLECVAPEIAGAVTQALTIPVIGIGCGHPCDGQIAVTEDLLGLTDNPPGFAEPLADLRGQAAEALTRYAAAIRDQG